MRGIEHLRRRRLKAAHARRLGQSAAPIAFELDSRRHGAGLVEDLVEAPPCLFALCVGQWQQGAGRQATQPLEKSSCSRLCSARCTGVPAGSSGRRRRQIEHGAEIVERRLALIQGRADARQQRARLGI